MKEKITIHIKPEDVNKAIVKGMKKMRRERAKAGRFLESQVFKSKKGVGKDEKKYLKHMHIEDLDEETLEEIREKLRRESDEEDIY